MGSLACTGGAVIEPSGITAVLRVKNQIRKCVVIDPKEQELNKLHQLFDSCS